MEYNKRTTGSSFIHSTSFSCAKKYDHLTLNDRNYLTLCFQFLAMKLTSSLTLNGPFIKSLNNQEVVSLENSMEDFLTKLNMSDNNLAFSLNKPATDQLNNQSIKESKEDRLDLIIEGKLTE